MFAQSDDGSYKGLGCGNLIGYWTYFGYWNTILGIGKYIGYYAERLRHCAVIMANGYCGYCGSLMGIVYIGYKCWSLVTVRLTVQSAAFVLLLFLSSLKYK